MALVREVLAEHPGLRPELHEARLTAALARQRDARALGQATPRVVRSLFEGLVERLAFFARLLSPADGAAPARRSAHAAADARGGDGATVFDRIVEQWLGNVELLWRRLEADRSEIDRAFGLEAASVVDARTNLGDPHDGGHTVSRVSFSDGTFLIYKPRPVHLERFFSEVLAWASTPELRFEGLRVLDRDAYGWVLGVPRRACDGAEGVRRFHERLGGLLAIAYAFGATDLHEDNLVAHGEHPVLLDLETLITPIVSRDDDGDALAYSVFDIGLLPAWLADGSGALRLSGGIGGGLLDASVSDNVPRVGAGAEPAAPFDFIDEVLRGFHATWRKLCEGKSALLALATTIEQATYRVVLRPTREYWRALIPSLAPAALGDTAGFRLLLARALGPRPELAAELASLEALDVPSFVGTVSSTTVRATGGGSVAELVEPPRDTLSARIEGLRLEAATEQGALVAAAFAAAAVAGPSRGAPTAHAAALTPLEAAGEIAERLRLLAVSTRQGGLDWLAPSQGHGFALLGRVDPGLASGRAGITTFFAAMARATGESRYRDVVRRSLAWQAPLRASLARHDAPPRLPSGGGVGVGSLVYALTIAGQLLDDASLIDDALAWSAWVPDPRAGDALDAMNGHAGNILGLLALGEAIGDDEARRGLLARAAVFGEYVASHATADDAAWTRGGFAYGADGIAYALARLGRPAPPRSPNSPAPSPAAPPPGDEHGSTLGFCHGAAGRALASAGVLDDGVADAEQDYLCCGNAGLIDVTLELGLRADRPAWVASSRARAARLLARTGGVASGYRVPIAPSCPRPGLFDGLAGIGYMWLRQVDPELPCVLLHATLGRR